MAGAVETGKSAVLTDRHAYSHERIHQACKWRKDWYHEQIEEIAMRAPSGSVRGTKRAVGALLRQFVRLRSRPGRTRRPG